MKRTGTPSEVSRSHNATALQKRHWLCLFHWWHLFLIIFGILMVQCWVLNISHCFEHKTSEPCQCRRFDWNRFVSKWRLIGKCHDQGADGNPYAGVPIRRATQKSDSSRFRVSGFGFRRLKPSFAVGFGFRVSGFGFRRLKPTFAVGFGFRVSGFDRTWGS